jgi:hypothetical protein
MEVEKQSQGDLGSLPGESRLSVGLRSSIGAVGEEHNAHESISVMPDRDGKSHPHTSKAVSI